MTIKTMHKKYPQKVLICLPKKRDSRGFVTDWTVLHKHYQIPEAEKTIKSYEEEHNDVVIITTFTGENDPVLSPEQSAKYFRVLLNRN